MKITTPSGYTIELTTAEAEALIPDVLQAMRGDMVAGTGGDGVAGNARPVSENRLMRRVLKRHRISPGQRAVYQALYEAGDEGLDMATLAAAAGRTPEELNGTLGALGRRINATRGVDQLPEPPGVTLLFEQMESAPPSGKWGWAMKPALRELLNSGDFSWVK